jgi:hypothetical protein
LFPLDVPEQAAREVVVQSLIDQVEGIAELLSKRDVETGVDALGTLKRAWPTFVAACRQPASTAQAHAPNPTSPPTPNGWTNPPCRRTTYVGALREAPLDERCA